MSQNTEAMRDDAYRPTLPNDVHALRDYLRTRSVVAIRAAANGMAYRHESTKSEIIEWLVRYLPEEVRRMRTESTPSRAKAAADAVGDLEPMAIMRLSPAGIYYTITETINALGINCGVVVTDPAGEFVAHYGSFTLAYRCIKEGLCDVQAEPRMMTGND